MKELMKKRPTPPKKASPLLLRADEVLLRALTELPLLHGRPLYNEAQALLKEVRAALTGPGRAPGGLVDAPGASQGAPKGVGETNG
jgi:hypothetical protein